MSEAGGPPAGDHPGRRSPWERALDLLVYGPAGFVLDAAEHFDDMATKGRDRLGLQVGNARVMGRFALDKASRDLKQRFGDLMPRSPAAPGAPATPTPTGDPSETAPAPRPFGDGEPAGDGRAPVVTLPSERATSAAAGAAIEGYDTLSASQVVRRLDGLGGEELRAVYRHEAATRGRRTILHRVQQLLGPGGASADASRSS